MGQGLEQRGGRAIVTTASSRLVFAGTSPFAVPILQGLQEFSETACSIVGVVTQPDRPGGRGQSLQPPPVKVKALELQIPVHQPATLKNDDARNLFTALAPDLLVVVAYGKLLPAWLLALPRFGAINLHGSLLPRYRGAAPIQWAMANGETETGVCVMQLDEGLDTGPVFACEKTPIDPDESVQQLSERLASLGNELMKRAVAGILAGTLHAIPQDHNRATLAPILTKEDGVIDWTRPARTIYNRMRAFHPWPGSKSTFRGMVCKVLKARVGGPSPNGIEPGMIVLAPRSLSVACGDGMLLEILEIQLPNKKPQTGADFINGLRVVAGERLTDN
jgi:methionyl-tRNA formyltransferase